MSEFSSGEIYIFKSLFKGREDVFAVRWDKDNKGGYMPAYRYDPYLYRIHKMKGGTFQNYKDKTYLQLTDTEVKKHLNGEQLIGVYPLLIDNTSWFMVADFDKENWIEESKKFVLACNEKNIPVYLERSRSGNGSHVWIFFEQPYPAVRSRKIFTSILEQSGTFSIFDKNSSFDRLFPNQDFLSGKGLGNLIALPLFRKTLDQGNSCFIDSTNLQPIQDQWQFLKNIKRISTSDLDNLYQELSPLSGSISPAKINGQLTIVLNNEIRISRDGLATALINYLKEELNFANSSFIIKKKVGRNTFGTERYFKLIEDTESEVIVPRGFIGKLIRFSRENKIDHKFIDERKRKPPVLFSFNTQLREHQKVAIDIAAKKDIGVIVAPPGSGKTIVALKIISEKQQPALIIVHRKQLVTQWIERVETFLGIPKSEIGKIGYGNTKPGKKVTIATIQSLSKELTKSQSESIRTSFGTIIVDECHHVPAETFRNTIAQLQTRYLYGLTATAFRKYNDGKLIFIYLGEIITQIKTEDLGGFKKPKILIRNTELDVPFKSKTDRFETLSKILVHDTERNGLILKDVTVELNKGKRAVILTERKEHIDTLYQYLKGSYETITLSGDDSAGDRSLKWQNLNQGNYQILITTGQFFGEGSDLQNADCLFLVYPFSFEGKLIQYIGRVQRSEVTPTIYDYRDIKIEYLNKLFLKRNLYYRKIDRQATLFDEPEQEVIESKSIVSVQQEIKIPIAELEFRYGSIAFNHIPSGRETPIEFEIDNENVRPEFEVLKAYFCKLLKSKDVKISIDIEFEDDILVSQLATSSDIEKINKELIESVKFNFIQSNIFSRSSQLLDESLAAEILKGKEVFYKNDQAVLDEILNHKNYKHSRQLRYLAKRHEPTLLKVRFIISPFSFLFLLAGDYRYHVVLETLDTEEATYIWHLNKSKDSFTLKIKEIDCQLNIISSKGRQEFLETNPVDFSRIQHDYSDEKKGFIIWKDLLDERLA
jgi:superfamily II DNA or RNA helicase